MFVPSQKTSLAQSRREKQGRYLGGSAARREKRNAGVITPPEGWGSSARIQTSMKALFSFNHTSHAGTTKKRVERAKLPGMPDFMLVHKTFIMNNQKVLQQTAYFLKTGIFRRGSEPRKKPQEENVKRV